MSESIIEMYVRVEEESYDRMIETCKKVKKNMEEKIKISRENDNTFSEKELEYIKNNPNKQNGPSIEEIKKNILESQQLKLSQTVKLITATKESMPDVIKEIAKEQEDKMEHFKQMEKITDELISEQLEQIKQKSYFTPDVSDIRVGYECEADYPIPGKFHKLVIADVDLGFHISMLPHPDCPYSYRTPHLTKEQIEAEGLTQEGHLLITDFSNKEPDENLFMLYKGSLALIYNKEKHKLTIWQRAEKKEDERILFDGNCPSINEFRYIVKLLNIGT